MAQINQMVCLADFEKFAMVTLPKGARDYFKGQNERGSTVVENEEAFTRYLILPRPLRDVSKRSTNTTILGYPVAMPICISPTAYMAMAHPDGEKAVARAAQSSGTIYCQSTLSNFNMKEVRDAAPECVNFFQLYILEDRQSTTYLVQIAEEQGYKALVLTVDNHVSPKRWDDLRSGVKLPSHLSLPLLGHLKPPTIGPGEIANIFDIKMDPSLTGEDIKWLKSITSLPVIVKGILTPEAAQMSLEWGADGIIVSNHGGRNLDTVPSTIDALAGVVDAVAGRCEVYVDGGFRCGTDVLKALALGARAVFIGRPIVYGLTYNGQRGVEQVIDILKSEFSTAMALSGCAKIEEIDSKLVISKARYLAKL